MKVYTEDTPLLWLVLTTFFAIWRLTDGQYLLPSSGGVSFLEWYFSILIGYSIYIAISFWIIISNYRVFANPINKISKELNCRIFLDEYKPGLTDIVRKIARSLSIRTPEILLSESIRSNALCIGKEKDDSAIIISQDMLERLHLREISTMLAHELCHAKMFIRNRTALALTKLFLFRKGLALVIAIMVPFLLFYWAVDLKLLGSSFEQRYYFSPIEEAIYWNFLFDRYYIKPSLMLGFLLTFFLFILLYVFYKEKVPLLYQDDVSEFLADSYSAIFFNNPEILASVLQKLAKNRIIDSLTKIEERKYLPICFMKAEKPLKYTKWHDVLRIRFTFRDESHYGLALRIQALKFIDRLLHDSVKIKIIKKINTLKLIHLRLYNGYESFMLWNYLFAVNNIKKEDVKKTLQYLSQHEVLNLNECSKVLHTSPFQIFLILSMLLGTRFIKVET